jgi:phosphatidylglycerophosphate synthase
VRSASRGAALGLLAQIALLAALSVTVGLTALGWWTGMAVAVVVFVLLSRGLARAGATRLGPADWVTLARSVLVGGITALTADSLVSAAHPGALVALAVVALVLDGVDGWVARRTGTASYVGAIFDQEVDAYLILVLCTFVAPNVGWWVLILGLARYLFMAAGWFLPWMNATLPPRYWRKVVAAAQGIVLTAVASGVLPGLVNAALLAFATVLLAESFGRDVWWLWRHRDAVAA